MALAVVQVAHATGVDVVPTATFPGATTVGNTVLAIINGYGADPTTLLMSDSKGNTWTFDYSGISSGGLFIAVYASKLTTAGTSHSFTWNAGGSGGINNVDIIEISGLVATTPLDKSVGLTGAGTSMTTAPSGTLTQADEIVIATVAIASPDIVAGHTVTEDPTFTLIGENEDNNHVGSNAAYKIVASTASVTHAWTTTFTPVDDWRSAILTYKGTAAAPTGVIAVTAASDTPAIVGTSTPPAGTFTGTIVITEAADVPVIVATFTAGPVTGALALLEADDTAAITVSVVNPTPTFRYPVRVSGRKFLDQLGGPWLLNQIASWGMASQLNNAEITQALEGVAARHFNAVLVILNGATSGPGWNQWTNDAGQPYFATVAGGTIQAPPIKSPLGAGWQSFDWVVSECTRLGLTIAASIYGSADDSHGIVNDMLNCTIGECYTYGNRVAERYAAVPNLIWHYEAEGGWNAATTVGQRIDAIFHGIVDSYTAHGRADPPLMVAEPTAGSGADNFIFQEARHGYSGGYQWFLVSAGSLYKYTPNSTEAFDNAWVEGLASTYPIWDCEPAYIGSDAYGLPNLPPGPSQLQNFRERNYAVLLRGGIGINFGDEGWWPFDAQKSFPTPWDWQAVMTNVPEFQAQYCWDLLDTPTTCRDPAWGPIDTFVTTGIGSGDTKAAAGMGATTAAVYFPTNRSVTVNTTVLPGTGPVRLRWFDPVLNSYATIAASEAQNGSRSVTYPSNHADGASDYILIVDLADTASGTIAAAEATDVIVVTGTVTAPATFTAVVAVVEDPDVVALVGTFTALPGTVTGTVAALEEADTVALVGTVAIGPVVGVVAITEAGDIPIVVGFIPGAPTTPSGPLVVTVRTVPPPLTVRVTQP